jgi:hypothetical protein
LNFLFFFKQIFLTQQTTLFIMAHFVALILLVLVIQLTPVLDKAGITNEHFYSQCAAPHMFPSAGHCSNHTALLFPIDQEQANDVKNQTNEPAWEMNSASKQSNHTTAWHQVSQTETANWKHVVTLRVWKVRNEIGYTLATPWFTGGQAFALQALQHFLAIHRKLIDTAANHLNTLSSNSTVFITPHGQPGITQTIRLYTNSELTEFLSNKRPAAGINGKAMDSDCFLDLLLASSPTAQKIAHGDIPASSTTLFCFNVQLHPTWQPNPDHETCRAQFSHSPQKMSDRTYFNLTESLPKSSPDSISTANMYFLAPAMFTCITPDASESPPSSRQDLDNHISCVSIAVNNTMGKENKKHEIEGSNFNDFPSHPWPPFWFTHFTPMQFSLKEYDCEDNTHSESVPTNTALDLIKQYVLNAVIFVVVIYALYETVLNNLLNEKGKNINNTFYMKLLSNLFFIKWYWKQPDAELSTNRAEQNQTEPNRPVTHDSAKEITHLWRRNQDWNGLKEIILRPWLNTPFYNTDSPVRSDTDSSETNSSDATLKEIPSAASVDCQSFGSSVCSSCKDHLENFQRDIRRAEKHQQEEQKTQGQTHVHQEHASVPNHGRRIVDELRENLDRLQNSFLDIESRLKDVQDQLHNIQNDSNPNQQDEIEHFVDQDILHRLDRIQKPLDDLRDHLDDLQRFVDGLENRKRRHRDKRRREVDKMKDLNHCHNHQVIIVSPATRYLPDPTRNPAIDLAHVGYRLATLSALPSSFPVSRIRTADAGFYFLGQSDEVRCYSCGLGHSGWRREDNPLEVHRRLSPRCPHVVDMDRQRQALVAAQNGHEESMSADGNRRTSQGAGPQPPRPDEHLTPSEDGEGSQRRPQQASVLSQPTTDPNPQRPAANSQPQLSTGQQAQETRVRTPTQATSAAANTAPGRANTDTNAQSASANRPVQPTTAETRNNAPTQPQQQSQPRESSNSTGASPAMTAVIAPAPSTSTGPAPGAESLPEPRPMFPRASLDLNGAVYPMYQDMQSRRRTFATWDASRAPPLDDILLSGFFYAGE